MADTDQLLRASEALGEDLGLGERSRSVSPQAASVLCRSGEVGLYVAWEDREQTMAIAVIYGVTSAPWYLHNRGVVALSSLRPSSVQTDRQRAVLRRLRGRFSLDEAGAWLHENHEELAMILAPLIRGHVDRTVL